ncbi:Bromo domain-containing protein [Abeliophyllum distichum]|uniref:Bromo domain-containing protein n=1 Tax=Abeliophyllum distichum TaxID=126358 RepID=A0ABD1VV76_9LAMI
MSRKTHKANWRDGNRRKSPRISASDAWKENQQKPLSSDKKSEQEVLGKDQGPPSRTRTRTKRKFGEAAFNSISKIHKQVWKGRDNPQGEDHSTDSVRWTTGGEFEKDNINHKHDDRAIPNGKPFKLPEKRMLELILDILQRRDTYEIFAEPVESDEVEDYYEIIKEPMDFATMRAKLHEGMYQNLEQFEHDVFLISENAMHFNSTATIYFRQARAIHELAKKVFHVLRTDPENFISEFSGTRRRSMRKALSVAKDSRHLNVKVSNVRGDVSSKRRLCSPSRPSPLTRTAKGNPGCTGVTAHNESRYCGSFTGLDGRKSSFVDIDRRSAYRQWRSSLQNENDSVGSKPLILMNQGDISYRDSLMSFAKDLGSMAQMVAERKLLGRHEKFPTYHTTSSNCWIQSQICQVPSAFATLQSKHSSVNATSTTESGTFPGFIPGSQLFHKADNIIDLTDAEDGEEANDRNQIEEKTDVSTQSAMQRGLNVDCISKHDKVSQTRKSTENRKGSCLFNSFAGDLNSSIYRSNNACTRSTMITVDAGKPDDNVLPVILALENSHSVVPELKSRNKKSLVPQTSEPPSQINDATHTSTSRCQATAAIFQNDGACSPIQTTQPLELKKPVPSVSQFCFDIPFLKAQLNQMKTLGREEFSKSRFSRGSDMKKPSPSFEKRGFNRTVNCTQQGESSTSPFLNNQSWPSVDNSDTNLALQL